MIARQGRFVEYSVFGKETSVDWTIISDAKGQYNQNNNYLQYTLVLCSILTLFRADDPGWPLQSIHLSHRYLHD